MDFIVRYFKYGHEPQNVWETSKNFPPKQAIKELACVDKKEHKEPLINVKVPPTFKLSEYVTRASTMYKKNAVQNL